jgi:hypothetical protein
VPISEPPAKSKTAYADEILARGDLSPELRRRIEDLRDAWQPETRPVLRRPERDRLIGCHSTFGNLLEAQGKVDSFLHDKIRLVTTASVYRYLIDRAIETFSAGEPLKARMPKLARHKAEEAAARRAAKTEGTVARQARAPAPARRPLTLAPRQSVHERDRAAEPLPMARRAPGRPRKNSELVPAAD